MNETEPKTIYVRFPATTIVTVLITVVLIKAIQVVAPLLLPLLIAILVAVSMTPIMQWLVQKNWPRGLALTAITFTLVSSILIFIITILPLLYREAVIFIENLPHFREEILKNVGSPESSIHRLLSQILQKESIFPKTDQLAHILGAGNFVLTGVVELFLIFILSIYLVADGPRLIAWVSAFFEPNTQLKINKTFYKVSKIVSAYVFGQFLTSALAFVFALASLTLLGVPNAILLATLAGIFDILPVLGFFLAVIPAMLFAAGVSINLCWIVLALYIFYHALESYLIIPLVYGNQMRVSSFIVFFSLLAAGLAGGIKGALVILPIVASYPIVERIWLRRFIRKEALVEHTIVKI